MKLEKHKLITAGLVGITACSGMIMASAYADTPASSSSSTNASVTVANTINLTLTGGDLVIDNLTPGNASDSNIITATITSNSPYGYHLSATTGTSSGTTSLVNTADSNFSFTNLSTNKATLNDFSDNTWGYSYSTDNGTTWISGDNGSALTGYNGLPLDADDSGATGVKLLSSDTFATSGSVQFKIGARASSSQAAGTYTGTVNFYAVTNPAPDNTMQGFAAGNASTTCAAMSTGDTLKLKDSRDNTEYTIGKLADGKCWLLDNLALDLTNSTVLNGMNESNTHASNTTLNYLRNGGGSTSDKYATAGVSAFGSTNSFSDPRISLATKNTIPSDAISQAGQYKVGGYYNYCATSAGSYCYGNGTNYGTSSGDASEDICPKGWRIPTGSSSGEYSALANAIYGSTDSTYDTTAYTNYRVAYHAPLSGLFYSGMANYQGSYVYFWSSTRYTNDSMSGLYFNNSYYANPNISNDRSRGSSVRCVLDS